MSHHRAIALVFTLHGAVAGSLSTRLPWIQDHLSLSPAVLGLILLCLPVGAFVAMPMAGRLSHRLGGRAATRVLIACWCAALALPALAPAPAWLFGIFLLYGAAAGSCDVVMNAQAVALERRLGRSIIAGLHGMWCVGSLAAGGLGVVAAHYEVDARLHLGAVAALLLAAAVPAGRALLPNHTAADAPAPRRFALPPRAILLVGLVGFFGTFAEGASANWAAVYATKVTAAGPGLAAAAYTGFMLAMAGARLLGDRLVRRLGPVLAVRLSGAVAALGGTLVVAAWTPWACLAGFALLGTSVAIVVPLVFASAGNAAVRAEEGVAGVATITYLSGLVAPAVTGWAAGALSYRAAFALVTVMVVLMGGFAGALRQGPAHDSEEAGARQGAPAS
ncbi:MFS transporter [Thermoactinospora rubra]|uniref:MFS transporter n=1 Tax=Thermoactinospora rubra TaxID=1088767 RepID=UPI000A113B6D|nr:MFS transporter [Thermoactinospora rubra]